MKASSAVLACSFVLFSSLLFKATTTRVSASPGDGRCGGEPCNAVERGAHAFVERHLEGLGGNGRACADCHMASDDFQLSPADVEARFQDLARRKLRFIRSSSSSLVICWRRYWRI